MCARTRHMCARIRLLIVKLHHTLVPNSGEIRDDQALKQLINDIMDMIVLCTPLNDLETKKALCGIPRQSNP